ELAGAVEALVVILDRVAVFMTAVPAGEVAIVTLLVRFDRAVAAQLAGQAYDRTLPATRFDLAELAAAIAGRTVAVITLLGRVELQIASQLRVHHPSVSVAM